MKRIVLFGNGHVALGSFRRIMKKFNVVGVIVPYEDSDIENLCRINNIKYSYCINDLEEFEPELCLLISYGNLIPDKYVEKYKFINVHYGLLPKYRGMHTVAWAMINGENEVGYTIHEIDDMVDNGDILLQKKIKIYQGEDRNEIMKRLDVSLEDNICDFIKRYINNEIIGIKQDISKATFYGKRNIEDCLINWNDSTENILNFIRALVPPYPGAYTNYNGDNIIIISAEEFNSENYKEIPGHIVYRIENYGVIVKTKDTTIAIKEIMVNNKIIKSYEYIKIVGGSFK